MEARKGHVMQGILTEPKHILDELMASQENGNVIGLWSSSLGTGLYMCNVERVFDDEVEHDKVIILKEKDLNGVKLQAHVLFLQEIEKAFAFTRMPSDAAVASPAKHTGGQ